MSQKIMSTDRQGFSQVILLGVIDFLVLAKQLYQCPECGFHYADKEWAEKYEAWCREYKSCNIEITARAEENKKA